MIEICRVTSLLKNPEKRNDNFFDDFHLLLKFNAKIEIKNMEDHLLYRISLEN